MNGVYQGARPENVTPSSHVQVATLVRRCEGDEWVVGCVDTGQFVAVPAVALDAIDLLEQGLSVRAVQARLVQQTGTHFDIAHLVASLGDAGLLRAVDGQADGGSPAPRSSLAWLRARHVAWVLHPAVTVGWALLCLAAVACLVSDPSLLPSRHDLVWSRRGSVVLMGNAALAWTILFLHELGHLVTARAAGVPGRISLGTRLQFLVAQTDVTAVWASPRRVRLTVYLAGIAVNLALAAVGLLVLAVGSAGSGQRLAVLVTLISLMFVPSQAFIFMRTDLYFVAQDLAGCRNLYGDAVGYGRFLAGHVWRVVTRRRRAARDPSAGLPVRERRTVRAYCVFMIAGTVVCLVVAATVTVPVVATLLLQAARTLLAGGPGWQMLDASAVLLVTGGVHALWARTWWRKHGGRLRRITARSTDESTTKGATDVATDRKAR